MFFMTRINLFLPLASGSSYLGRLGKLHILWGTTFPQRQCSNLFSTRKNLAPIQNHLSPSSGHLIYDENAAKYIVSDQVLSLLKIYKTTMGNLNILPSFTVKKSAKYPWPDEFHGIKLGVMAKDIHYRLNNNGICKESKNALEELGFVRERKTYTEKIILEALLTYQVLYGNLSVPRAFVVNEHDPCWSKSLWGMKLGHVMGGIRNKLMYLNMKKCLQWVGFDYSAQSKAAAAASEDRGCSPFDYPAKELILHDRYRGDTTSCPEQIQWIKNSQAAGHTMHSAIKVTATDLSLHIPPQQRLSFSYDEVKEALVKYKNQFGNMLVPYRYLTEFHDQPMKLGWIVQDIRGKKLFTEHREELEALGFDYSKQIGNFNIVRQALLFYQSINGNVMVPYDYQITEYDERYPAKVRGMELGSIVKDILIAGRYIEHRKELLAMGFNFDNIQPHSFYIFAQVKEALLTYKTLHGDLKVSIAYIIAKDDIRYPERVRGMKLGIVVSNIRNIGTYADHREELEAMGFLYDQQKRFSTFPEVKEALLTYKALYGHLKVPQSYIIAEDDIRYPERVRGMKLGSVVHGIRNRGYYADQREELEAMGFLFDRQMSTFAEVKEALLTYKASYGDLKVPTAYIIAENDTGYPEGVRGMKLGKVVSNIRNIGTYADHREELVAMGFLFERQRKSSQ